jgi:hypothetical protein
MSRIYEGLQEVPAAAYTSFDSLLIETMNQWHEAHRQQFVKNGYTNLLDTFDQQEEKHAHVGAKYIRLDVGGSGAWMLETATGIIYNIKGYGKVDKKKIVGDINDTAFDGAVLFRDRFRHGRFDNRKKSMLEIAGIKS